MKKIWISLLLFLLIIAGGILYNNYVNAKTDNMLSLADEAYEACEGDLTTCHEKLEKIDEQLESMSVIMCAFLDRDVINDAKDAIVSAKGLAGIGGEQCRWGILTMKEKIDHIKNSAQIKWKYIL
ncbi:MAG: DUF4363 family protein [Clostridia bacterium]|nr:DUF4363 family protein [Clostridia bacterium]